MPETTRRDFPGASVTTAAALAFEELEHEAFIKGHP